MRILLDENVPANLSRALIGHHVRTVPRMRWSGVRNGNLLRRAATEFEVFLTLDKSMEYQQVLPAGLAMIILRARSNRVPDVVSFAAEILVALEKIQPGDIVYVGAPFRRG